MHLRAAPVQLSAMRKNLLVSLIAFGVLAPLATLRPEMFQAQRALALLRERQGRKEEAVTLLRRALALRPDDGPSREALARLGGA